MNNYYEAINIDKYFIHLRVISYKDYCFLKFRFIEKKSVLKKFRRVFYILYFVSLIVQYE